MMGLGMQELLVIAGIMTLMFGGKKIAELGKGVGQAISGFRKGLKEDDQEKSE